MIEKLEELRAQWRKLQQEVENPSLFSSTQSYRERMRDHAYLSRLMEEYDRYLLTEKQLEDAHVLIQDESDADFKDVIRQEIRTLEAALHTSQKRLKTLLIPPDPFQEKNIIMEIRGGTGGDEAALFAADLFRMYTHYAESKQWRYEVLAVSETELGGFKEITFSISGRDVYGSLRYESGVHRVQRVPSTEASGRIHTSAVTVAVLPEMEETEVDIRAEDVRVDVMRASGPGGQCVNTTDSAVRLTHLPTGIVVVCQDEKSQIKNKAKAMRVLRSRVYDLEESKRQVARARERKSQVGSGDRSERIRTYNFPQNRVTDHRVRVTLYKLDAVMQGALDDIIEPLCIASRESVI